MNLPRLLPVAGFILLSAAGCTSKNQSGPVITVEASYPGGSSEVVAQTVAAPLEQQIAGRG